MNLGPEIKRRRTALGLTQTALADLTGVSQGRVGEYERGERTPTLDTLAALAEALGPFQVTGGVRDADHYRALFAEAASIGTQLAARAIYAARFGHADDPEESELREIFRVVQLEFGESLTSTEALSLMEGE